MYPVALTGSPAVTAANETDRCYWENKQYPYRWETLI